jgi:hypothetical protein
MIPLAIYLRLGNSSFITKETHKVHSETLKAMSLSSEFRTKASFSNGV